MIEHVATTGQRLRKGYTTGACAAAAARAAARMLFTRTRQHSIEIDLPRGGKLVLPVTNPAIYPDSAVCSVLKDGGDDADITTGLHIFARVELIQGNHIEIRGGEGVGVVTKPGLSVPAGEPAINPTPRRMITREVNKELPPGRGVKVTVFVPEGKQIARKTFNPRLGIEGGISILGTTGIVEPMSEEALKQALDLNLKVLKASGSHRAVLVPGKCGEDFAITRLGLPSRLVVMTSNFIGFMIDACLEYGINEVLLVGHIGKLIKVAGGVFHTHSKTADARMEILSAYAALYGADRNTIEMILNSPTTGMALGIIKKAGLEAIFPYIAARVSARCRERAAHQVNVGTILYSNQGELLAQDEAATKLREVLRDEKD